MPEPFPIHPRGGGDPDAGWESDNPRALAARIPRVSTFTQHDDGCSSDGNRATLGDCCSGAAYREAIATTNHRKATR